MTNRHWLSRLTLAMLDSERKLDYLWLGIYCAIPSILAFIFGAGRTVEVAGVVYLGWFDKYNFWPFVFVIPLTLFLLRAVFRRVAQITPAELPEQRPPPLVALFRLHPDKQKVYEIMRDALSSPKIMGGALVTAILINVADVSELVGVYLFDNPVRAGEFDWSVMYQAGVMSKQANALFCVTAYIMQFMITTLGIWGMAYLVGHNLFFLQRIYQRSRVEPGNEKEYITLDLDDVNRCFGFRAANDGFNTQVIALTIAGVVILMSRFANVGNMEDTLRLDELLLGTSTASINLFPDIGQTMLALGWVVALFIITAPALVKLTPRLPGLGKVPELTIDTYLREFLTDEQWRYGEKPTEKQINYIAAKFANNGFWPTGDNRASMLFFYSFWVFLIILYPVKTDDVRILLPSLVALGLVAYGLRTVMLAALNSSLSYVDERLTTPRPDLLAEEEEGQVRVRGKVFISYRREDSLAYARLLRQSLSQYVKEDNLFMDITTIRDGEDFVDSIETAIKNCDSLIAVIGPSWSSCTDEKGQRRLEKGDDFVRLEIATAFAEGKTVVPALVGSADMPTAEELTADIAPLWRRHARELSDSRWEYDVGELARALAESEE